MTDVGQNGVWADGNDGPVRPRFEHDCDSCVFLGQQAEEDVYFCMQGGSLPTVIFRWGDDGPEYLSGWHLRGKLDGPLRARLEAVADA